MGLIYHNTRYIGTKDVRPPFILGCFLYIQARLAKAGFLFGHLFFNNINIIKIYNVNDKRRL